MTQVSRYSIIDPVTDQPSGEFLRAGDADLGDFRDIVNAEYERAKAERPDNPAFAMRPVFRTGSPYGAEIMALAASVRGAK